MDDVVEEEIKIAFSTRNINIESLALPLFAQICSEESMTPSALVEAWDVYSVNNNIQEPANTTNLKIFQHNLPKNNKLKKNKENRNPITQRPPKPTIVMNKNSLSAMYGIGLVKSPEGKRSACFQSPPSKVKVVRTNDSLFSPTSSQSPSLVKYGTRTNSGKVMEKYNAQLLTQKKNTNTTALSNDNVNSSRVKLKHLFAEQWKNFSYMHTPLSERANVLEQQLVQFEEWIIKTYKISELHHIGDPSPAPVVVVGRICCEASEGKLNRNVVQIEGSRKSSGGQRHLLDLSGLQSFSLFPGKLVALEGIQTNFREPILVKKFYQDIPLDMPMSPIQLVKDYHLVYKDSPLSVIVASGPYTTSDDLDYSPLHDLIQVVRSKPKPTDVLILCGPFVDANHEKVKEGGILQGDMALSYEDIFIAQVIPLLHSLLMENEAIEIVLVPSLLDSHHDYVYPQPPFRTKDIYTNLSSQAQMRLHCVSNPSTLSLNEMKLVISTIDSLLHLGSNEINITSRNEVSQPRLFRLMDHMIKQHSFYPLFPPPPKVDAPIDLRHFNKIMMKESPDIFVTPSVLNRFAGSSGKTVCINPGQLCKGQSGGTYAFVQIFPLQEEDQVQPQEDDHHLATEMEHFASSRVAVEIIRI